MAKTRALEVHVENRRTRVVQDGDLVYLILAGTPGVITALTVPNPAFVENINLTVWWKVVAMQDVGNTTPTEIPEEWQEEHVSAHDVKWRDA